MQNGDLKKCDNHKIFFKVHKENFDQSALLSILKKQLSKRIINKCYNLCKLLKRNE